MPGLFPSVTYLRLIGFMLMSCVACRQPDSIPEEALQVAVDTTDTTLVLLKLEELGNIAYDHPEQFIHRPDSFLQLLPAMPTTLEGKEMYAWLLLNVGYALREHGNLQESARYYEQAMDYCQAEQLTEPDFVLYIAKPLGNLYTQIGDLQKALHIHQQAISRINKTSNTVDLPALYGNLAIVYEQIGQPDSLLQACRSGLAYLAPESTQAALLYNNMARCYYGQGAIDSTAYYNRRAIDIFSQRDLRGDTLVWYASALHQRSLLELQQQWPERALRSINQAIGLAEQHFPTSKQRDKAKYYYARGNLQLFFKQPQAAQRDFKKTLSLFAPLTESAHSFPDYAFTEALWGLARTHTVQQSDSADYYYAKAVENAYYTQQLIVSSESQYQNSAWSRQLLSEAMAYLWQSYSSAPAARRQPIAETMLWITELSKGRQLLQEINRTAQWAQDSTDQSLHRHQLQHLYQTLAAETDATTKQQLTAAAEQLAFQFQLSENHFAQQFTPPDFTSFMKRMRSISDSITTLSYFIDGSGNGYILSLASEHATAHQLSSTAIKALQVPEFISTYFGATPDAYDNNPARYRERATQLANAWLPIPEKAKERLILSPDGILHALPFDALIAGNRFIAETHAVNYTYTFLLNTATAQLPTYNAPVTLVAKQHYPGEDLRDLFYVKVEADYLADHFITTAYRDKAATDDAFFASLMEGSVVHLSAHAVADGQTPPYIVLNQRITLDKLKYSAAKTPLIFLSACQTATGQLLPGEGVESLNKAFLSKGISGVVAAHWPVDDETMPVMTRFFYEYLSQTGSPPHALALAKRAYLTSEKRAAQNPWYWASLNYTGMDTQIHLTKKNNTLAWTAVLLVLAFVGGIWRLTARHR